VILRNWRLTDREKGGSVDPWPYEIGSSDAIGLLRRNWTPHKLGISSLADLLYTCGAQDEIAPRQQARPRAGLTVPRISSPFVLGKGQGHHGPPGLPPGAWTRSRARPPSTPSWPRLLAQAGLVREGRRASAAPTSSPASLRRAPSCPRAHPGATTFYRRRDGRGGTWTPWAFPGPSFHLRRKKPSPTTTGWRASGATWWRGAWTDASWYAGPLRLAPLRIDGEERLEDRLDHSLRHGTGPLLRAHMGPYLPDRVQAVSLFLSPNAGPLACSGWLDVLSIGTSQLSQERFGLDWEGRSDGRRGAHRG
jgi:hypothetical protein